jgi:hypothetical protein
MKVATRLDCGNKVASPCKLNCGSQKFTPVSKIIEPWGSKSGYDIGGRGGECNCPDGETYHSGVKWNAGCSPEGAAYGCVGGYSSNCQSKKGIWSHVKIVCGKSMSTFWSNWNSSHYKAADSSDQRCTSNNCKKWGWDKLNENWDHQTVSLPVVPLPSGYGGTCKCPDGKTFLVTATDETCTSIACDGGTIIDCTDTADDKWLDQKVTCGKLLHTPTTCTECWTKDDITKLAYDSWEGKHSYTLKLLSTTDTDLPFKLMEGVCVMNCKAGHWSNWELDPGNPRPVTYAPNVYIGNNPSAGTGGTNDCTCPDGQKFATAIKSLGDCDSIDTHCKNGVVPKINDCNSF